jgi:hypothetical protein
MSFNPIDLTKLNSNRLAGVALLNALPRDGVGAEVGVYAATFSRLILQILQPTALFLIDPWQWRDQWFVNHTQDEVALFAGGQNTSEGDALYARVSRMFADLPAVKVMRTTSIEASKAFSDDYFDWVYIDGDHRYEPVAEDIRHWWPKLKPGGFLCGDDYKRVATSDPEIKFRVGNGVSFAVDEFLAATGLELKTFSKPDDKGAFFIIQRPKS